MSAEQNDHFPVPFSVDRLPESLRDVVRPGIQEALARDNAYHAIEEYWEDGGDRSAPTLLAYAFMRFTEACEIHVDQQVEEAERALDLCEEAREQGVDDPETVETFEKICRKVRDELRRRRDGWYELAERAPDEVPDQEIGMVADELTRRGEYERAIAFFERKLDIEQGRPAHTRIRIGDCYAETGDEKQAESLYRQVISDGEASGQEKAMAYDRWVLLADDDELRERFDEARQWADREAEPWPLLHDSQEKLLDRGLATDDADIATHAADEIEQREASVRRELRHKVEDAQEQYGS
jgi:tetratricopeptide (TPR) repeat protein